MRVLERLDEVAIVHHVKPGGEVYGSRGREILVRSREGGAWSPVATLPRRLPRDLFGFSRPTARLFRCDRSNVYVNAPGRLFALRGGHFLVLEGGELVSRGRFAGDCVLHGGIAEDEDGGLYFGEYFMNTRGLPLRVWHAPPDGRALSVVHEFQGGDLFHVHGIYRDPFERETFWLTAGDESGECHLYRTDDRFARLERFGDGGQLWRAVALLFTEEHVCWLTDSPLEPNFACRMDRRSAAVEVGQPIDCPSWYAATTSDGLHVAFTTVEPGPGVRSSRSSVLLSDDAFAWRVVASFEKDAWVPYRAFKHGVITCPSGRQPSSSFYLSGEALRGFDGASLRVDFAAGG